MTNQMELDHTHFRQMKKTLANIEKEWRLGAVAGVKGELKELSRLTREIETVIKNQLYYNLTSPEREKYNGQANNIKGRELTTTEE